MKIEEVDVYKDRDCNECHSQNNVKEIHVGANVIALCEDCREKLHGLFYLNWQKETKVK